MRLVSAILLSAAALAGCRSLETPRLLRALEDGSKPDAQVRAGGRLGEIGDEKTGRALARISTNPAHPGQDAAFIGLLNGVALKRWTQADMERWEDEALKERTLSGQPEGPGGTPSTPR